MARTDQELRLERGILEVIVREADYQGIFFDPRDKTSIDGEIDALVERFLSLGFAEGPQQRHPYPEDFE